MSSVNLIDVWILGKIEHLQMKKCSSLDEAIKVHAQIDILRELQDFCETLTDGDEMSQVRIKPTELPREENTYDDPRYIDSMWEK